MARRRTESTATNAAAAPPAPGARAGGVVTTADVARHLGLSVSTVAAVLGGRAASLGIRAETRERVVEGARTLGYRPNASARATRTGRFGSAALIQPVNNVYLPSQLVLGLADELEKGGIHLSVAKLGHAELADDAYLPKVLRELTADGLLVNMIVGVPPAFLDAVREQRVPTVWINNKQPADCVHPDDLAGGRQATEYLLRLGHERIAFAAPDYRLGQGGGAHYSVGDRQAGYAEAMAAAGLAPRVHALPGLPGTAERWLADRRVPALRELLEVPDRPTALVAYDTHYAVPALIAAARAGLDVPRDLSLVSFDEYLEQTSGVPVTHVWVNMTGVGQEAGQMLRAKIADPDTPLPPRVLSARIVTGGTTAAPPK